LARAAAGKSLAMAKSDLYGTLRDCGLRKSVARAVAEAERDGGQSPRVARDVLKDLTKAGDVIRARITETDTRARGAEKAAGTRQRNAEKRSAAAKRGAQTRKARARSR